MRGHGRPALSAQARRRDERLDTPVRPTKRRSTAKEYDAGRRAASAAASAPASASASASGSASNALQLLSEYADEDMGSDYVPMKDRWPESERALWRARGYGHDYKSGERRDPDMPRIPLHPRRGLTRGGLPRAASVGRRTDLTMPKRRTYKGRGSYGSGVTAAYIREKFPRATHGIRYVPRGQVGIEGSAYEEFGPSWAEASDEQRQARMESGFRGRGRYFRPYTPRGRYFSRRRPNMSFYF